MPTPFAAADVIVYDDSGRLAFHYAIVEVFQLLLPGILGYQCLIDNHFVCMRLLHVRRASEGPTKEFFNLYCMFFTGCSSPY